MRALFGVVSLLIVLAIVGIVTVKQMKASSRAVGTALPASTTAVPSVGGLATTTPPAGNVREQSQQLQQRVRDDVTRALEQGAAARQSEAEK